MGRISFRSTVWLQVVWCGLVLIPTSVRAQSCITDFREIYDREAQVSDTTIPRQYVVCPGQVFVVGKLDFDNRLREDEEVDDDVSISPPLPLRPNMNIRCGDDGLRTNMCWIADGDLQLDGSMMRNITNPSLENVLIQGFTFMSSSMYSLLATKPGTITFEDCEWKDFTESKAPIMLDYFDALAPKNELVVTFRDCLFQDNRYFGREAHSALIFGNSNQNRLIVERTIFENNDMVYNNTDNATNSFLIESLGPTCIDRSCFIDNWLGASAVAVFGEMLVSSQAHAANSSGGLCDFASSFQTLQQYVDMKPLCVEAMEDTCNFELADPITDPCAAFKPSPNGSTVVSIGG